MRRRQTQPTIALAKRFGTAWLAAVIALAAGGVGTGCVTVAEHRKLERAVTDLQRSRAGRGNQEQIADVSAEIEELNEGLRELNGKYEELKRTADEALSEARKARREAGGKLGAAPGVEGGGASAVPPATPGSEGAGGGAGGVAAVPGGEGADAEAEEGGSPDEIRAYQAGLTALRSSEYATCIDRFRGFLQTYASSKRADDAAFYIGDCHYRQGEFKQAVLRFDDVSRNYPTGNRAPDAVYRQGESLLKLGPAYYTAARKAFERVVKEYPDSARAAEAQKQLDIRTPG